MRILHGIIFGFLLILSPFLSQIAGAQATTVSSSGIEGVLIFQATVFMPARIPDTEANAAKLIKLQTSHLLSVFELPEFAIMNNITVGRGQSVMSLGATESYQIVAQVKTLDGVEITYRVRNQVIINKNVLMTAQKRTLNLVLPHDPVEIYARPCTDQTYYQKEYFFYYWNPFSPTCRPWLTGRNKIDVVSAELEALKPLSPQAGPDYPVLTQQVAERGEIHVSLLFGIVPSENNPKSDGWVSYNYFLTNLTQSGFKSGQPNGAAVNVPFAELTRPADKTRPAAHVSLSLGVNNSGDYGSFATRVRSAFETSDIVIYIDHSGLGGNLDLDAIAKQSSADPGHPTPFRFPNAYQIFYLDAPRSSYFISQEYNLADRGVHNADVISNGASENYGNQNNEVLSFMNSFLDATNTATWLQLLAGIDNSAKGLASLVNVSPIR